MGLPMQKIRPLNKSKKIYKQIFCDQTGYVKPKELVGILGPSGSGKTSLLNALSQRVTHLTPNGILNGKHEINGSIARPGDYAQVGAYVQQDDILYEILTPKELFTFAAKIRTNLDQDVIEEKIGNVLTRLGLDSCKDQMIGGWFNRGISGGERKRASIGYELITDPSILLLDEPTSGLDSSTAGRIIEVLRKEALHGMSVLASIH
jgi:ABC-type multidrug transport system ATPase subunit